MKIIGGGLLIFFIGVIADSYWHAQVGGSVTREIVFAHLPLSIGVAVVAYGAVREYDDSSGFRRKAMLVLTVLASAALLGRVTDDIFHLMGDHETVYNTAAHTVWGVGFVGMLITFLAALVLPRWFDVSSEQVVDEAS